MRGPWWGASTTDFSPLGVGGWRPLKTEFRRVLDLLCHGKLKTTQLRAAQARPDASPEVPKMRGRPPTPLKHQAQRPQHTSICSGAASAPPPSGDAANHLKCVVCVLIVFIMRIHVRAKHLSDWMACVRKKKKN